MIETIPTIPQLQRASMSIAVRVLAHNRRSRQSSISYEAGG